MFFPSNRHVWIAGTTSKVFATSILAILMGETGGKADSKFRVDHFSVFFAKFSGGTKFEVPPGGIAQVWKSTGLFDVGCHGL